MRRASGGSSSADARAGPSDAPASSSCSAALRADRARLSSRGAPEESSVRRSTPRKCTLAGDPCARISSARDARPIRPV
jgi:hypothetical protein